MRRALPAAIQSSDRWHLWHGLAQAAEKVAAAHSRCWAATAPKRQSLVQEQTTLERWHAIHNLLDQGTGLLDCSRRLGLSLDTVKRYARVPEPQRLRRPPQYRACLVDPYRDHLRARRAAEPGVSVPRLLAEITELGYTGGQNLLYRYINQDDSTGTAHFHCRLRQVSNTRACRRCCMAGWFACQGVKPSLCGAFRH